MKKNARIKPNLKGQLAPKPDDFKIGGVELNSYNDNTNEPKYVDDSGEIVIQKRKSNVGLSASNNVLRAS